MINETCNTCTICPGATESQAFYSKGASGALLLFSGTDGETIDSQERAEEWTKDILGKSFGDYTPDISWAVRCNINRTQEAVEGCGVYTRILIRNYSFFVLIGKAALQQVTSLENAEEGKLHLSPVPFIYFLQISGLEAEKGKVRAHLEELEYSLEKERKQYES